MRYTDNNRNRNRRSKLKRARRNRNRLVMILSVFLLILCAGAVSVYLNENGDTKETKVAEYAISDYAKPLYREGSLFAEDLCVASGDVALEGVADMSGVRSAALFDVNGKTVDFSYNMHERLYPASTTKVLTALVAIRNGNLDDMVTVSGNADAGNFAADEQICGIMEGDQMTLRDLLYGLILNSGNDNAVAIAEYVGGTEEAFVEMMNAQAAELMATNTHFINSNGLHSEEHYTTAYDMYLIFNEAIKLPEFVEILRTGSYTAHVTRADGSTIDMEWTPTHFYASGAAALPTKGATVVGGKTGFHDPAGSCLILLNEDASGNPYISVVMGAESKEILYQDMTSMIEAIPEN